MKNKLDSLLSCERESYGSEWQTHYLQVYLSYTKSAEAISEKRTRANAFFLSLNIAILSGLLLTFNGTDLAEDTAFQNPVIILVGLAGCAFNFFWCFLIQAYKNINAAKFLIIQETEKLLPLKCYSTEGLILAQKKGMGKINTLTFIETFIPIVFTCLFVIVLIIPLSNFICS